MSKMVLVYGGATAIGAAIGLWQSVFVCVGVVAVIHGICLCMLEEM